MYMVHFHLILYCIGITIILFCLQMALDGKTIIKEEITDKDAYETSAHNNSSRRNKGSYYDVYVNFCNPINIQIISTIFFMNKLLIK